jgi:hypothetical protein
VFTCESGLNPAAVGDSHLASTKRLVEKTGDKDMGSSYGVAQVRYLPGRPEPEVLLSIRGNLEAAKDILETQGWNAWTCYKKGNNGGSGATS